MSNKLRDGDKRNFETLLAAAQNGDLALLLATRRADGAEVALVCAVNRDDDASYAFIPLAVMVEGNPFEDFDPPDEPVPGVTRKKS